MVKKQQLAVGGFTCILSSSSSKSFNKQQYNAACPSVASAISPVLPRHPSSSSSAWQWPWTSCGMHPRTLSFRQQPEQGETTGHGRHHHDSHSDDKYHGVRVAKQQQEEEKAAYHKTWNSVSSGDFSFTSTASSDAEAVIIQALRSDRLLYEPADHMDDHDDASCCRLIKQPPHSKQSISRQKQAAVGDDEPQLDTSSIVLSSGGGKANKAPVLDLVTTAEALATFCGATAMSVESHNPYRDFRDSMQAMVMSQQGTTKDWRWLEDMLGWYLRANGKTTHALIVAAFVDLIVALAISPPAAEDYNYSSFSSSSSLCLLATPPASASATNCSAASSSSSIDDCSC
ncbi:Transcription repressor OFP13 [Zea mays]|uniref:Transcription repressor n=1 Tax=Zea mays TaxID=4577 RepID=A0A3L6ECX0_MAIZE|nr:Transcription repressor OFP13 [Zea mays]